MKRDQVVTVHWAKNYKLPRQATTTGADTFYDPAAGFKLVVIPSKAMLFSDANGGERLADECVTPEMAQGTPAPTQSNELKPASELARSHRPLDVRPVSNVRPAPDTVLVDIVDYVLNAGIDSARAGDGASLPDRHARMRTRGALLPCLHQAARPRRARHDRAERREGAARPSSSIPCRPPSASAR